MQAPEPAAIVTQSMPETMASMDPSDSILFWSDERRSAAFRDMEGLFPGLEVAQTGPVRALPRGTALGSDHVLPPLPARLPQPHLQRPRGAAQSRTAP